MTTSGMLDRRTLLCGLGATVLANRVAAAGGERLRFAVRALNDWGKRSAPIHGEYVPQTI